MLLFVVRRLLLFVVSCLSLLVVVRCVMLFVWCLLCFVGGVVRLLLFVVVV